MSEIPERFLEQARDHRLDLLSHDMRMGENAEWLWQEIDRMMTSKDPKDAKDLETMTIGALIDRVCEAKADKEMDDGDLDEDAYQCAVEAAESRADYFQDR